MTIHSTNTNLNSNDFYKLGVLHKKKQQYKAAYQFLEQAINLGHINAIEEQNAIRNNLLKLVREYRITKDFSKAIELSEFAMELQIQDAIYLRAEMYRNGEGTDNKADFIAALMLYDHSELLYGFDVTLHRRNTIIRQLKNTLRDTAFNQLINEIETLRKYGFQLVDEEQQKGQILITHSSRLLGALANLYLTNHGTTYSHLKEEEIKNDFKKLLHSADASMGEHRAQWFPIVSNILIALTGVGLLALLIKTSIHAYEAYHSNKAFRFSKAVFFASTHSEELVEDIDFSLDNWTHCEVPPP